MPTAATPPAPGCLLPGHDDRAGGCPGFGARHQAAVSGITFFQHVDIKPAGQSAAGIECGGDMSDVGYISGFWRDRRRGHGQAAG